MLTKLILATVQSVRKLWDSTKYRRLPENTRRTTVATNGLEHVINNFLLIYSI